MVGFVLASILFPALGSCFTLVLPRAWVKLFSQIIAFLAFLSTLIVLVAFYQQKAEFSASVLSWRYLVFGIVVDKLSVLIGLAFTWLAPDLVYSGSYLSLEREHPEK
jgi:NADH:ubiquinone oxidoreductase subunit 5 (subunit L)/multisubunit Na+/H+ antiporter MnhA subunit